MFTFMRCIVVALLIVATGSLVAAPIVAKDYKIKLHRPEKVGNRYRLSVTDTSKEMLVITKAGEVLKRESKATKAQLDAIVEVQKVDKVGDPVKLKVRIEKLIDGKGVELLTRGQIVLGEVIEKKVVFRIKDGKLGDVAKKALRSTVDLKTIDRPSLDNAFGTKEPRRVGDSWKLNPSAAAKYLKMDPKNISGNVTLAAIKNVGGYTCYECLAKVKITDVPGAEKLIKQGFEIKSAKGVVRWDAIYSTDQTTPVLKEDMGLNFDTEFRGVKGAVKGLLVRMTLEAKRTRMRSALE